MTTLTTLDPTYIVGLLAGAVVTLAGIIYKILLDRISKVESQNDKLNDANHDLQISSSKSVDMGQRQLDLLGRILAIVEAQRYGGNTGAPTIPTTSHAPPKRRHVRQDLEG